MLIPFVKAQNMRSSSSGYVIPNQFVINTSEGKYFQSFDTVIAFISRDGRVYLDPNWESTTTTGKYRNMFLGEKKFETKRKVLKGEYEIINLN